MVQKTTHTPMMEQYLAIKANYQDAILFYRLGDFYEMFLDDAITASRLLEITLTARNKNADNPIPMCGVPYHSATDYIKRLVESGYKVAICEQVEDPKVSKGMVKREVVRVITPGTVIDQAALHVKENNYLAAIHYQSNTFYMAYIDITTGELKLTQTVIYTQLMNELRSINPSEIVILSSVTDEQSKEIETNVAAFLTHYGHESVLQAGWELTDASEAESSLLNQLFAYLDSIHIRQLEHIKPVERYTLANYMQMNHYAKGQLELTKSLRFQKKKGSLLDLIDKTQTAMGGRLLAQWLEKPLLDSKELTRRHQYVEQLMSFYFERVDLMEALGKVYDLERLVGKLSLGNATARDIDQLRGSLKRLPHINYLLQSLNEQLSHTITSQPFEVMDELSELVDLIDAVLVEDPPLSLTEGNVIKKGYNEQLDDYRDALENGQSWLAELQQRERELTGLKTLKVGYNKVFGYYIEISRLQAANLKDDRYIRKQTLANAERYITDELKKIEATILGAQEKATVLEYELFAQLRKQVSEFTRPLQTLALEIAQLDVLVNFANLSEENNYVRAELTTEAKAMELQDSRHPVVENLIGRANFVPNNIATSPESSLLLLTGPNMSGKSTFMRQVAYAIILNQIGCFVPASYAKLPIIDKIFTRIGSSDDTASGQSTFMVEMMETNSALEEATPYSLLLFDEIGRGTATFDGMALAEAIIRYIAQNVQALTIFSTHYHELTKLEEQIHTVRNIHVGAKEYKGELVFLHKVVEGPADKSYGIQVARLAGLPEEVIQESQSILIELETHAKEIFARDAVQLDLFSSGTAAAADQQDTDPQLITLCETITKIDINELTPLAALQHLADIQKLVKAIQL